MRAVLINTTHQNGHHGCTLVNRQLDLLASAAGVEIVAKLPAHVDWSQLAPSDFDLVLVNGEGCLHHDSTASKQLATVPGWAHARNKPAVLINSVYQSNSDSIAQAVAKYDLIFVRDMLSQKELAKAGIPARCVPDLTLTWTPAVNGCFGHDIIVTDSTFRSTTKQLYRLARRLRARFLPMIALPPEIPDAPDRNRPTRSRYETKLLASRIAPPGIWRARYRNHIAEFDDFVAILSQSAGLIIAGRFHALCMALVLEIPMVALRSSTWKTEALLDAAGLQHRLVSDLDELGQRLASDGTEPFLYASDEIARIRALRAQTLADAEAMFAQLHHCTEFDFDPSHAKRVLTES